jgi:Tfp pilus assembly protein PilW
MKNKGVTLVELVVSIGIMLIVFSLISTTYLTTQRLWKGGFLQVMFQSSGRIGLDKISRNLRSATSAATLDNGDRVRFVLDPNRTPGDSSDDVTCEYYITGTNVMYDPDILVSSNEVTLLNNVIRESAVPFFQISGNLIVVTYKVFNTNILYGTHWASMSTSINMRNV